MLLLNIEIHEVIMHHIHKKIVTDETMHPVAVQIDYADWLEIEKLLRVKKAIKKIAHLSHFAGTIKLTEDPLEYQSRIRGEWE